MMARVHTNRVYVPPAKKQLTFYSSPNTVQSSPEQPTAPLDSPIDDSEYDFIVSPFKQHKAQIVVAKQMPVISSPGLKRHHHTSDSAQNSESSGDTVFGSKVKFSNHSSVHVLHTSDAADSTDHISDDDTMLDDHIENKASDATNLNGEQFNIMSYIDVIDPHADSTIDRALQAAHNNKAMHVLSPTQATRPLTASASKLSASAAKRAGLSSGGKSNGSERARRKLMNDGTTTVSGTVKAVNAQQQHQQRPQSTQVASKMKISSTTCRSAILLDHAQALVKQSDTRTAKPQQSKHRSPVKSAVFNMYETELVGSPSPRKANHILHQHTRQSHAVSSDEYDRLRKRNIVLTDKLTQKDGEIAALNVKIDELKESVEHTREDYEFDINELNDTIQRLQADLDAAGGAVRRTSSTFSRPTLDDSFNRLTSADKKVEQRETALAQRERALEQRLKDIAARELALFEQQRQAEMRNPNKPVTKTVHQISVDTSSEDEAPFVPQQSKRARKRLLE